MEGFLMDHKEGAAYREAPLPFFEKNNPVKAFTICIALLTQIHIVFPIYAVQVW